MDRNLRVGIIGANAERGWARISHVPAVQALPGLTLHAVATTSQASADAAAKAFGAAKGYASAEELIRDPAIDIVSVAVNVPDHRKLVLAAAAAGKNLYCEWPLGRDLGEAEEFAAAVGLAGTHAVIGLQTRMNPAGRRARELISAGATGRVLSARIVSTTAAFGPEAEPAMAFAENAANGATLATIQGAHTVDFAISVLGPLTEAAALATMQFPQVTIADNPAPQARSTPDHLLLQARTGGGAAVSIEVAGGRPADSAPFHFEVTGEAGSLVLTGGALRGFQSGRLRLLLNGREESVEEGEVAGLPDTAANVGGVYAALRDDMASGAHTTPGFDHAVRLTRLVEDILASSADGTRKPANGWPESA